MRDEYLLDLRNQAKKLTVMGAIGEMFVGVFYLAALAGLVYITAPIFKSLFLGDIS